MKKISNAYNAVTLWFASMAAVLLAGPVAAQTSNIGEVADTVGGQLQSIGNLIMGGSFIVGIGFVGIGLMRLKAAVDTQGQQTKYSEGLWRIGLGAAMVALPAVVGVGMGTFGFDNTNNLSITDGF